MSADHDVTDHPELNRAIDRWASENVDGGLVVGFALVVAVSSATDAGDRTHYLYAFPDGQQAHSGIGLGLLLQRYLNAELDDENP